MLLRPALRRSILPIAVGFLTSSSSSSSSLLSSSSSSSTPSSLSRHAYSMVALDMDGTLLNEHHALSPASIAVLRALSSRGVVVALATGRSAPAVYDHVRALGLPRPLPVVCYNGASCRIFPAAAAALPPLPSASSPDERTTAARSSDPKTSQRLLFDAPLSR